MFNVVLIADCTWLEERTFISSRSHSHTKKQVRILLSSFTWCHFCHTEM